MHWLAIAIGGSIGAMLRFAVSTAVHGYAGRGFPYGTLAVNLAGCLLMGLLASLFLERLILGPEWRAAVLIGVLGAFTTFSAFALETVHLLQDGRWLAAGTNMLVSTLGCVLATGLGLYLGRQL